MRKYLCQCMDESCMHIMLNVLITKPT